VFTGLIEELGRVSGIERSADGATVRIETRLASELSDGESIAMYEDCLTATEVDGATFYAEAMN